MGYKEKVDILAKISHENDIKNGDDLESTFIMDSLDSIVDYHNFVIRMESQMQFQKFRCEQADYVEWLSSQNEHRILKHQCMIDSVAQLNRYCVNNDCDLFYEGHFDDKRRYDDLDTRLSIAAMSEEYCSELFLAGQNEAVNQKHIDYVKSKVLSIESSDKEVSNIEYDLIRKKDFDINDDVESIKICDEKQADDYGRDDFC